MIMNGLDLRRLGLDDMGAAAAVMRASYDERLPWLAGKHTPAEDQAFFRDRLLPSFELWGAFDGAGMIGLLAFRDDWIDQLYILPSHQGRGVGTALLDIAKTTSRELMLRTFQANAAARRFYERHGFVIAEETDGSGNEEREPDVLYRWRRGITP